MATFNKVQGFVEHLANGAHDFGADQLVLALTNVDPGTDGVNASTAAGVLASLSAQVSYTNLSSRNLTVSGNAQTSGTYKLTINDITLTSTLGSTGPFRYVYIYNDSATTASDGWEDPLIGYYDYGSSITLADGESLTVNFDDANGVLTLA